MSLMTLRRSRRYAVVPLTAPQWSPEGITHSWGLVDFMLPQLAAPTRRLAFVSLPGVDGPLRFDSQGAAQSWIRRCGEIRAERGGPVFLLPGGWHSPNSRIRAKVRSETDPWKDLTADEHMIDLSRGDEDPVTGLVYRSPAIR